MTKSPYIRAAGISLLFHSVLLGLLLILGNTMVVHVSNAAPIEIIPASVIDTGNTLADLSSPAAMQEQQAEKQLTTERTSLKQEAVSEKTTTHQTNANAATVLQTSYSGAATVGISNAVAGNTGDRESGKSGGQEKKAVVRTQAGYLSGSRPAYPRDAWQAGWEGIVVIRVLVGVDGSAAAVSVQRSSGYGSLDAAAARAVKQWRFSSARQDGVPMESYHDVRVRFSLADTQVD
ncbi:hypothetical protein SPSIL_011310 [Sporomusa silvacetica DSM 10669]|uniref:TonB C-terminal domain-containing protein n=1 Tax=Sporomusa silvacetica DSM 10669 TaxID=1123289 RepID=A0ABZ3IHP9_9FIRM|nr:energy transducer TonB [Sporomusa silvacetica]OZC14858.1 gram-negative bacterial tonB protein [Sporomusa silvacetica DSM 10669]